MAATPLTSDDDRSGNATDPDGDGSDDGDGPLVVEKILRETSVTSAPPW